MNLLRSSSGFFFAPLALSAVLAACSSSPPQGVPSDAVALEGFTCGGIVGNSCPPDSTCPSCSDPDCGGQCYAVRDCTPSAPSCADGFSCDPQTRHCMPARTCNAKSDCDAGQLCVKDRMTRGICVKVEAAPSTACSADAPCKFPYDCFGGAKDATCRLRCIDGECPSGMSCSGVGFCETAR